MANHIDLGKKGEALALEFLNKCGYSILESNWSSGKAEIDIIAKDAEVLVFIEVKTRSSDYHGFPEESVTIKKQKILSSAASRYMEITDYEWEVRFDIISIVYISENDFTLEHFKDAFFPGL